MRPPVRLLQPLEAPSLRLSKTLYVCSNCRYDVSLSSAVSNHQHQARRHAGSGNTPFTEKVRRKIWGTDNPPGLEDPYGGEGVIAREWNKRKAQYTGEEKPKEDSSQQKTALSEGFEDEDPDPEAFPEEQLEEIKPFVPATTAHDLKRVGYLGKWQDFPPTEGDAYRSFVSRKKASTSVHFRMAAQSVAVELSILHTLNKPLSLACDIPNHHHKSIWALIRECRITPGPDRQATSLDSIIEFPNEEAKENLFFVFNQFGDEPESQSTESDSSVKEVVAYSRALQAKAGPQHAGYLTFPLVDLDVKLAYIKRFSQITGHYVPDSIINTAKTVQDIVEPIEKSVCRPKKLAEELSVLTAKQGIPNIQVNSKPYTKDDQDREVGRAKIIEEVLRERGLTLEDIKGNGFRL